MKIALAGNPNSGKTTIFNAITGKTEHVGNWPGVTVEKIEGTIRKHLTENNEDIIVVDLPGAYSMSPYTNEESITKEFVLNEKPDVIVNIVDSTNLSRHLFFTLQLIELAIPVVVALNKIDLTEKKGNSIDARRLSELLGCQVVETSSMKSSENGLKQLVHKAMSAGKSSGESSSAPKSGLRAALTIGEYKAADRKRYEHAKTIVEQVERRQISSEQQTGQDRIDRIVAHKWLGIPIFATVIWLVFSISQAWVGPPLADIIVGWTDNLYGVIEGILGEGVSPLLSSLLLDGIIGGFGAVVGFLPLIMVLFFCLALLEDCGYMARVAVVLDRFFKKIGLSGRSIIPMIVGTGCAIPGIMATRTIKNERQRRTTAMLTPFMPCGAKLPIIALFAGVFFSDNAWIGTSMYFLGILVIIVGGMIVKRITGDDSVSYFIMELPEYKIPSIKRAMFSMLDRAKEFVVKAGTIILICNAIVHILQTFNWQFQVVNESAPGSSILASISEPFALLFIPLGFGLWQFAAASITGFIAKENVVGTLAVTFSITNFIDVEELALVSGAGEVGMVFGISSAAALSYLVFNLFTPPCFAAIGAMNTEMESSKWLWGGIAFQLGMGYTLAFIIYQIGTLASKGTLGQGFLPGLIAVLLMVSIVGYLMVKGDAKANTLMEKVS